ncbi:MAG: response regulator [Treponema sp.]|jgi:DNA-binding response OmpR family regulator|nr:response regulator [Treponema sp.]
MDNVKAGNIILLVDDDELQLAFAEEALKHEFVIYTAKSGNEALHYLYTNDFIPNLILLDILMPEMDGWEVFNRIKAISMLKNVPIIFLTAVSESKEKERAYEIGADDFITKPYDKETLVSRVKAVLNR